MGGTPWKVEHNCPQCGGPIALTEDEHILTCDYCHVRLFVVGDGGPRRYVLPPRHADVGSLVMVPYWRLRGLVFRGDGEALTSRLVDGTRVAAPAPDVPPTLGVRPQAMALRFASGAVGDRFVSPTLAPRFGPVRTTRKPAARLLDDAVFEVALVPATSIVYLPVRLAGGVFDAVASRRIGTLDSDEWLAHAGGFDASPPAVRFFSTLCPWCSWQLDGEPSSLVLTCGLCRSVYAAGEKGLTELSYGRVAADGWEPARHVPFWRVSADIGKGLESWADFVRFANLPVVVRPGWESQGIHYWLPAFATSPDQFVRFARTMTVARLDPSPAGRSHEAKPMARPAAVTLPPSCLPGAVKVLLGDVGHPKAEVLPRLAGVTPRIVGRAELVYVPLDDRGPELVNPESGLVVQRAACLGSGAH